MLLDSNPFVVSNSIMSIMVIQDMKGQGYLQVSPSLLQRLILSLEDNNEWGQSFVLDYLSFYEPLSLKDSEFILESIIPYLNNKHPNIVIGCV